MAFISIDENRCKKDYICVEECPSGIFRAKDQTAPPTITKAAERLCVLCGHCVAVCPHQAIDHEVTPLKLSVPINNDLILSNEQAVQYLRSRRSARKYKDKPVDPSQIEKLIMTARYAPSAGNGQPVHWTVFTDKEKIREIASICADWMKHMVENEPRENLPVYYPAVVKKWEMGHDEILRNAPALIIASAPANARWGTVDIAIALTYLELATVPLGLMGCWAGFVKGALDNWQPMKEFVGLPEGHSFQIPMMIGYGKHRFHRLPERKQPKIFWK